MQEGTTSFEGNIIFIDRIIWDIHFVCFEKTRAEQNTEGPSTMFEKLGYGINILNKNMKWESDIEYGINILKKTWIGFFIFN